MSAADLDTVIAVLNFRADCDDHRRINTIAALDAALAAVRLYVEQCDDEERTRLVGQVPVLEAARRRFELAIDADEADGAVSAIPEEIAKEVAATLSGCLPSTRESWLWLALTAAENAYDGKHAADDAAIRGALTDAIEAAREVSP